MIRGDNDLGEIFCAGSLCDGNGVPVQTIIMKCAPYVKEGEAFDKRDIKEEQVPLCEKDFRDLFPTRAKWAKLRFIRNG
jgi:hypothetical protein